MDEKLRKRALAKAQRIRIYSFYRNLGVLLIVVGLPLAIYLYLKTHDNNLRKLESNSSDFVEPSKSLEFVLKNGNVSDLQKYSRGLDAEIATGLIPRQYDAYRDKLRISDELIRRDQDENSVRYGILTKISASSALSAFDRNLGNGKTKNNADLLAICEQYAGDGDPDIRSTAELGKFTAHIQSYLLDPTNQEFAKLESKLDQLVSTITPDALTVKAMPKFVETMSTSKNAQHASKFNKKLAESLQNSLEPALRNVGDKIMDGIIIGSVDYAAMRRLIRIPDQQTISQLETIVTAIENNPNVSVSSYADIFAIVEGLRRINQNELETRLMDRLRGSTGKIKDRDKQNQVLKLFDGYDTRNNLFGHAFDLGREFADNPALPTDAATVILFFSPFQKLSCTWVASAMSLDQLDPLTTRYIIVCTDAALGNDLAQEIKDEFPNGILIGPDGKDIYLQQCPITHIPYIIILDRNKRVAAVNVDIDEVRTWLLDLN